MVLESDVGAAAVKKFKDWPKLLQIKAIYYTSIAHVSVLSFSFPFTICLSHFLPLLFLSPVFLSVGYCSCTKLTHWRSKTTLDSW